MKPPAPADRGWSGCAVVAGDSNEDLPGAHRECVAVADKLGAAPIIGDACTVEAVRDALTTAPTDRLDVVQLRPVSKEYPGRAVTGEQQAAAAPASGVGASVHGQMRVGRPAPAANSVTVTFERRRAGSTAPWPAGESPRKLEEAMAIPDEPWMAGPQDDGVQIHRGH